MANELKLSYDASQTVTASIYDATGEVVGAPTMTETPAASGIYVGSILVLSAGDYTVAFSSGGYVIACTMISWDGAEVVDLLSLNTEVAGIQSSLAGGVIISGSPIASDGTISIVRGDDYSPTDGRGLAFTFTTAPSLTGGTVSLVFTGLDGIPLTFAGSVVSVNTVVFSLTSTETGTLASGDGAYEYSVVATLSDGHVVTLQTGAVNVTD